MRARNPPQHVVRLGHQLDQLPGAWTRMGYRTDGWHVVVGLGSAGSRHVAILQDLGIDNVAVVRTHLGPTSRPTPAGVVEFPSIEAALERRPVMAIVATPTALHHPEAAAFVAAGVPVFVEKPLTDTVDTSLRLLEEAQQADVPVAVGYHLRYHPGLLWLRELISGGLLGRPLLLRATWGEYLPDWHPGEDYRRAYAARQELGGGPVLTLSHVVDYTVWLLGSVDGVQARTRRLSGLDVEVPDTAVIALDHDSGAMSDLELDFFTRPPIHRVDLRFETGWARWDVTERTLACRAADASIAPAVPDIRGWSRDDCFVAQLGAFLAGLRVGSRIDTAHDFAVARALGAILASADDLRR